MAELRRIFASQGYTGVETFIASGNVIFETDSVDSGAIERAIEAALLAAFGYEIDAFVRTSRELADIAAYRPFPQPDLDASAAFNIAFTHDVLDGVAEEKLAALRTEIDDFRSHNREVYWLCRLKQSQSTFSNAVLEKTLGKRSTLRGASTVKKLAAKYLAA
jgi:uncharacterized protein (DUF1697 family)